MVELPIAHRASEIVPCTLNVFETSDSHSIMRSYYTSAFILSIIHSSQPGHIARGAFTKLFLALKRSPARRLCEQSNTFPVRVP